MEEEEDPVQLPARSRAPPPVPRPRIRPHPGPTNPEEPRPGRRRRGTRSPERGRRDLGATAAAWDGGPHSRSEVDGIFQEECVS